MVDDIPNEQDFLIETFDILETGEGNSIILQLENKTSSTEERTNGK